MVECPVARSYLTGYPEHKLGWSASTTPTLKACRRPYSSALSEGGAHCRSYPSEQERPRSVRPDRSRVVARRRHASARSSTARVSLPRPATRIAPRHPGVKLGRRSSAHLGTSWPGTRLGFLRPGRSRLLKPSQGRLRLGGLGRSWLGGRAERRFSFACRPGLQGPFLRLLGRLRGREPCIRRAGYLFNPCCDLTDVVQ